ncbi:indolepyruvate oxidoreductase [Eggerthellaceae bacterium zg-893]|nr:indolepyruvate oxidoreductase [Eggerthellaceae bacterium zg-893]
MAKKLLMGNEAFAHAALEAGVRVVAGYPGTPSSELVETVASLHADGSAEGVHVEWSTNEKAALELLAGAAYAGARVLFTCKQVGLNVASDALMSLNYVGVKGGTVLFVADDPGPISSQTEQDTRRFASFAKVPVLDPATPDQGFQMMKAAFDLSERYGTPVIVRPTTRICHASTFFDVAESTQARPVPPEGFERDPRWVIFPRRAFEAHGEINDRLSAIAADFANDPQFAAFNPTFCGGGAGGAQASNARAASASDDMPRLGIVAGGVSAAYVLEALRMLEKRAAAAGKSLPPYTFWQVGTVFPFPRDKAMRFLRGVSGSVIVFEELDHVLEDELLATIGAAASDPAAPRLRIRGKLDGTTRDRGENSVEDALVRLAAFLEVPELAGLPKKAAAKAARVEETADEPSDAEQAPADPQASGRGADGPEASACAGDVRFAYRAPSDAPLPVRPPVLCAGCPHRGSFYAVKRALGKAPAVLCGDIGCYTLGNAMPLDAVDTCLCMGAGITMAQGFSVAEPGKKALAFVGDSTFFASAMTGIANAVYNGHDVTFCILDNATTAMTGSQPHPGTGVTLMGERRKPLSIPRVLEALGVERIVAANPLDLQASIDAVRDAVAFEGPSAVIFTSPCVQLFAPSARAAIDVDVCRGCKKCITEIGCPGIGFNADARGPKSGERGQAFVDAGLCNGCGLCVQVCPFDAISVGDR